MIKDEIRDKLESLSDKSYREFNEKLQSTKSNSFGVRMGDVRNLARELAKSDWKSYVDGLSGNDLFEEKLIGGMSVFYSKASITEKIEYSEKIIPLIDGWAVCDSIYMTPKIKKTEKEAFWDYIIKCACSRDEFRARVGLISMLHSYVDEEYIDRIIEAVDSIEYAGYYDKMGAAWLLADCMVKFPERTFEYMKSNTLDDWVFNKAITKMRESFRVSDTMKSTLKTMMRKNTTA